MENYFDGSGGQIWYELINKNSDKNLLLIHGFIEDHEIWDHLKKNIEVNLIVVDMLGFGKSTPADNFDFSMQQQAIMIHELLEFLSLDNLFVLGHSMGGYVTLELSLLDPEINIGLLHSTCAADDEEKKNNRNKTIQVLERDPSVFIREFYWNLFAEHRKNEFAAQIEILRQKAEKISPAFIIETVKGLRDRKDHTQTWKLSGGNNILIGGTYDKLFNVEDLEELAFLGDAEWAEMKNSGHMGFYEEPEGLVAIIRFWLGMA